MSQNSLYSLALKDLLTPSMLVVTLMPIVIIFGAIILFSFLFGENIFSYLYNEFLSWFNIDSQNMDSWFSSNVVLSFIGKFDFLVSIFKSFFYAIVIYIGWNIAIIVGMVITGFFAPYIIKTVNNSHYNLELKSHGNIATTLSFLGVVFIKATLLFLIGLIFFWVPILNVVLFYFAFYYLFHKMLVNDVSSEINLKEEIAIIKNRSSNRIRGHSFLLYLLNNIPILGFLIQTYSVIYMAHLYLIETKKVREEGF